VIFGVFFSIGVAALDPKALKFGWGFPAKDTIQSWNPDSLSEDFNVGRSLVGVRPAVAVILVAGVG
jgi:hypothetical protein